MPKKYEADGQSPLSHYWMPPEKLEGSSDSGVGGARACLATTFEFDAAFFEGELLPRFLGLKFDQTENEPSFVVEREVTLESTHVAVMVDASRFNSGQTTLRWDQVPVRVPGGVLHAKITMLFWDRLVRVIVGSANLTRTGYRRNREVFAALDFWDSKQSVPLSLLHDVLNLLTVSLEWAFAAPAARDRARETIDVVRQTARRWDSAPREFTPRERPRVTLAVTHPKIGRSGARSALGEVLDAWGTHRATSVSVVTPFVGQDKSAGARDRVVDKLKETPRTRDCHGYLVVPELPGNATNETIRVGIPKAFGRSWEEAFTPSRALVLPLPLCVEHKEERNRALHSKAILLESEDDVLLMVGSSNFTPHGMGIDVFNLEANLVFVDRNGEGRDRVSLADRLQLPLDWDDAQGIADVVWQEPELLPEDAPVEGAAPPPFFSWASYSQKTGELKLELDRAAREPRPWLVRLPGNADASELIVFAHDRQPIRPPTTTLSHTFSDQARGVSLVALVINWTDVEGQSRSAKLGVCAESVDSLLPPSEFRELGADAIIDCLISGKSPAQWYDHKQRASGRGTTDGAALASLRAVDTSGYLFYRVRRFGRALTAMREGIGAMSPRADAIRYRLLNDPFGPLSLAKRLLEAGTDAGLGTYARLDAENHVFLLAELLLTVGLLRERFQKATRGKDRKRVAEQFREAENGLTALLDGEGGHGIAAIPDNLRSYVAAVQDRIGRGAESVAVEVRDAG